jgi:cold shock CspA family protein
MSSDTNSSRKQIGCVKWFNNKTGFGFITSGGSDIFVHHSNVQVASEQYKYLVQGEYVEFVLSHTANGTHSTQAAEVTGIQGGKLMCETRNEFRKVDESQQQDQSTQRTVRRERSFNGSAGEEQSSNTRTPSSTGPRKTYTKQSSSNNRTGSIST